MTEPPSWLRAGAVGRPHGLDGSFHVADVVASVFALLEHGSEVRVGSQPRRIVRLAGHAARPILRLQGCDRREDADALRGLVLSVPRALAPALDDDEWWAQELEGCTVRDGERVVGIVAALLALPSCEVLEVTRDGAAAGDPAAAADPAAATGSTLLVPLIRDAVRSVDVQRHVIDVDMRFLGEGLD